MRLNTIFQDGIIFSANKPIRIYGEGGGVVTVRFCGEEYSREFFLSKWVMELPARDYGGPFEMEISLDGRIRHLHDIYIGDTYLLAGQSNVKMSFDEILCPDEKEEEPNLRMFCTDSVERGQRFIPEDGWVTATEDKIGRFSALGYLFGKYMARKSGHKVGIVMLFQGAANIQCFLPRHVFEENPHLVINEEERHDSHYPWNRQPSILYDFLFKDLMPFSYQGVIWYQGESNTSYLESRVYGEMLHHLITEWRKDLENPDLPFVVVQIHDCIDVDYDAWRRVQEAQLQAEKSEYLVKTVITKDISDTDTIHPFQKKDVAIRAIEAFSQLEQARNQ